MEDWDQDTLEKMVDLVCKYFLEAIEKKQYGWCWFWDCPNGGKDCHYRHALPSGHVLKSHFSRKRPKRFPIEEEIENQKKMEETGLAAQQEKRAKNDHMSDQALFLSDSCLFVDDTKAYEKYQREVESEVAEQKKVEKHPLTFYSFVQNAYDLFKVAVSQPKVLIRNLNYLSFSRQDGVARVSNAEFSYDLNVQRKGEKIDTYSDKRDKGE
ncbi:zinc finger CCCH domain-containing protein 11-like [Ziziphus jujuba]|uniref:Zinc finger CCCH domain-containing protein 11-like n=1 Tax=Ziziphus jujuba TaxID=326968 RepID=A0ABM4AG91_ZIZJJ|nr:zinc finger CCCH domain-containing protein 11-like [Ziziphus jujuba]